MQTVTTIGLDIVKSVFQVHGIDVDGQVVIRRQLKRDAYSAPPLPTPDASSIVTTISVVRAARVSRASKR